MKQFSLDEFKKNPNRKVVTRDGRPVRIICTDAKGDYPVLGLALDDDGWERPVICDANGCECTFEEDDLFLSDEQSTTIMKEGWVGIYRSKISNTLYRPSVFIYDSEKKIEKYAELHPDEFIGMAKVTWEE